MPASAAPAPPGRRRRGPGPVGSIIVAALVLPLAVLWALFPANYASRPGIQSETVAWRVHGDTAVQITYAVAKLKGDTVRCVVDAFDTEFAVIHQHPVVIPAGTSRLRRTETLPTPHRATGARIRSCRSLDRSEPTHEERRGLSIQGRHPQNPSMSTGRTA
ncbi:DUF4307 domain-containing protein [Actinomadura verrucosospora]|nr:DUF4307 domain-containing protein [Actinomadura verrucosospora]